MTLNGTATRRRPSHAVGPHAGDQPDRANRRPWRSAVPTRHRASPLDDMGALAASGHDPDYGEYLVSSGPTCTRIAAERLIQTIRRPSDFNDPTSSRSFGIRRLQMKISSGRLRHLSTSGGDGWSNSERWDGEVDCNSSRQRAHPRHPRRYTRCISRSEWRRASARGDVHPHELAIPPLTSSGTRSRFG